MVITKDKQITMDLKMDSVIIHGKMVPTIKDNLRMAKEMD